MAWKTGGGRPFSALVVLAVALAVGTQARKLKRDGKKPNIIMFQPDDFPWLNNQWPEAPQAQAPGADGILSFGNRNLDLPNINRLRRQGVVFGNFTVTASICAASRFSTITGRYNSRGDYAREKSEDQMLALITDRVQVINDNVGLVRNDRDENFPQAMRKAGYRTGAAGKWHLGRQSNKPWADYDKLQDEVKDSGFDWADGLYAHVLMDENDLKFSHNMEWVTAQAKDFIKTSSDKDEPFFLYFNPTTPKESTADTYTALFDYSILETPAGKLKEVPESGMPSRVEMWAKAQTALTPREIAAAGTPGPDAAGVTLGVVITDEALGALLNYLESLDILDDTIIVFHGDHGAEGITKLYNAGVKAPFFISGPGFRKIKGAGSERLISNIDLARTMFEVATGDDDYPFMTDGVSFLPVLKDIPIHNNVFLEAGVNRGVQTKLYKLIHLNDVQYNLRNVYSEQFGLTAFPETTRIWPKAADRFQLYDTINDPLERRNLISTNDEDLQDKRDDMLRMLSCFEKKLKLSAGDAHDVNINDCLDRPWCDDDDDDCDKDGDDDDDIDDDFDIQGSASGAGVASSSTDQNKANPNMSPLAVAMMKATWASAIQGLRGE